MREPGSRYIDFLIPGLLGMNLMGSGMWGVGFVIVDMRVRKLLKRLVATPMRKSDFLMSMIGARLIYVIPELVIVLGAGVMVFGIVIRGSLLSILALCFLGAMTFSGLGLLVASRAQRIETISGLMNLVQLPMWLFSGIFFSSERFPAAFQPLVQALPLTQLNNAFRAVILEGASLTSQIRSLSILALWGGISFFLALRWFRWNWECKPKTATNGVNRWSRGEQAYIEVPDGAMVHKGGRREPELPAPGKSWGEGA
jgi:ABC transporter DrrB family efflux protein